MKHDPKPCKSYAKYQGLRYPTCNGGNPCQPCLDKYRSMVLEREQIAFANAHGHIDSSL